MLTAYLDWDSLSARFETDVLMLGPRIAHGESFHAFLLAGFALSGGPKHLRPAGRDPEHRDRWASPQLRAGQQGCRLPVPEHTYPVPPKPKPNPVSRMFQTFQSSNLRAFSAA
ncbi:hypothetical protein DTO217A2_3188 [Paecilomyces variotii]|nr:hypothetical protein DTO217A2_3188 [Paecilomyces variotii]